MRHPRLTALMLAFAAFFSTAMFAHQRLKAGMAMFTHQVIPMPIDQKNQGLVLQQEAFARKDVLPLFGSSELTRARDFRASDFYHDAPTGFQICPIGSSGNTCLLIATKLAALGQAARGHKIAVLLSGGWFNRPQVPADHYAGNFSEMQAIASLENPALSDAIKTRLAGRFLDYPDTLDSHPLLLLRIRCQLDPPNAPFKLVLPVLNAALSCDLAVLTAEDEVQSFWQVKKVIKGPAWQAHPNAPDWQAMLASAHAGWRPSKLKINVAQGPQREANDQRRRRELESAEHGEWADLALLLDIINELQAKAIIIAMPVSGARDDQEGITAATRHECYYDHIARLCHERQVPVRTMEEHDEDPDFLVDYVSHPTATGWLHINRVLDDFWHDRPQPEPLKAGQPASPATPPS